MIGAVNVNSMQCDLSTMMLLECTATPSKNETFGKAPKCSPVRLYQVHRKVVQKRRSEIGKLDAASPGVRIILTPHSPTAVEASALMIRWPPDLG